MESNIETIKKLHLLCSSHNFIEGLILYGSSVKNPLTRDIDIACFISSDRGIVSPEHYAQLRKIRNEASAYQGYDVDLVPHTLDELDDKISPLYNPRYNPALTNGKILKGNISVAPISNFEFSISDLARYVSLDNRTITRRQLVRSLSKEEFSIFLSKLAHTPGNILTARALQNGDDYYANPSDYKQSVAYLDAQNKSNSARKFAQDIAQLRNQLKDISIPYDEEKAFSSALKLIQGFETMISNEFYPKTLSNLHISQMSIMLRGRNGK